MNLLKLALVNLAIRLTEWRTFNPTLTCCEARKQLVRPCQKNVVPFPPRQVPRSATRRIA